MYYIYLIISVTISCILFSILFEGMNKSMLKVFVPLQKVTRKLKRRRLYSVITLFTIVFIAAAIRDFLNLNAVRFGIILGFAFALRDIIFEKNIGIVKK